MPDVTTLKARLFPDRPRPIRVVLTHSTDADPTYRFAVTVYHASGGYTPSYFASLDDAIQQYVGLCAKYQNEGRVDPADVN